MAGYTEANPVKWATLLASLNVKPGDAIVLKDGTYNASDFVFSGVSGYPTVLRAQNPGNVKIDGPMDFNGQYVSVYDIEFMDSNPDRHEQTTSILTTLGKVNFYGCYFHDQHTSGLQHFGSGIGEVVECVFLNNGNYFPDESKHGHCLYTHNQGGGLRTIARNIFGYSMGKYALHIYSDNNHLLDYFCEDNITVGQPTHTGGPGGLTNFVYNRNVHCGGSVQHGRYGSATNGKMIDNIYIDIGTYYENPDWVNLTKSGDAFYGTGFDPAPQIYTRLIPFYKSRRWLASLFVYNRDNANNVPVNFSGMLAGNYKLRNAQNMDETWNFTFDGRAVNVPMNIWTCAQRIGDVAPPTTFPKYGAFAVEVGRS